MTTEVKLHAVLIGIDAYPPPNQLAGCVNDIDAVERLLTTPPGIGLPQEQIQVHRLWLPARDSGGSQPTDEQLPTRDNILKMLQGLADSDLQKDDRVLIYYSGHGYAKQAPGSNAWVESLVASSRTRPVMIYDFEVNKLIGQIAAKTDHLTVILDCCHSGGATRDPDDASPNAKARVFEPTPDMDLTLPPEALAGPQGGTRGMDDGGLFQTTDPDYLVVAACQRDEKANEGQEGTETRHGFFTAALMSALQNRTADQRGKLRWADIWPALLAGIDTKVVNLRRMSQHPWLLGQGARRLFGGPWEPMDPGLTVTRKDGQYTIEAGTLMGVTEGAELEVYGDKPAFFADLADPAKRVAPAGRLRVTKAENARAVAEPLNAPFDLPDGARALLVQPGTTGKLRVHLTAPVDTPELRQYLSESPLLELVPNGLPDAEVVVDLRDGRWAIGYDVEKYVAFADVGHKLGLFNALNQYYHAVTVLRMAQRLVTPSASQALRVRMLACPQPIDPNDAPKLAEVTRDSDNIYHVKPQEGVIFEIKNTTATPLHFAVFNFGNSGAVSHMTKETLAPGDRFYVYSGNNLGRPLRPSVPKIELTPGRTFVTDRLIIIGTDSRDLNLEGLASPKSLQSVIDNTRRDFDDASRDFEDEAAPGAPAPFWTATMVPWRTEKAG